jgi:hypothetical protein
LSRCYLKDRVDNYKIGKSIFVYDGDLNGIVFTGRQNHFTNLPHGDVRPQLTARYKGVEFFDTTLNKPIYWTGTAWVDATGATV